MEVSGYGNSATWRGLYTQKPGERETAAEVPVAARTGWPASHALYRPRWHDQTEASRFENAHQIAAFLGLVLKAYSAGEKQQRGHITKVGGSRMRSLLCQLALSFMRLRKSELGDQRSEDGAKA